MICFNLKKTILSIFYIFLFAFAANARAEDDFLNLDLGIPETPRLIEEIDTEAVAATAEIDRQEQIPPYLEQELAVVDTPLEIQEPAELGPTVLRMLGALAIVLAILFAVLLGVKKFGPYSALNAKGMIEIIEHAALAPGKNLHLVKVANETVLLASDNNGIVYIKSISGSGTESTAGLAPQQKVFKSTFENKIKDFQADKALKGSVDRGSVHDLQDNIHDIHAQIKKLKKMKDELL